MHRADLISSESVRLLRRRLREFLRNAEMGGDELRDQEQAGAPVDMGGFDVSMHNGPAGNNSLTMGGGSYTPVLVELVKQIPPLLSERPEDILSFLCGSKKYTNWVWRKTARLLCLYDPLCRPLCYSSSVLVYSTGIRGLCVKRKW